MNFWLGEASVKGGSTWPLRWHLGPAQEVAQRLRRMRRVAEDLSLNWATPAPFAEKYPGWYRTRWNLDVHKPGLDWTAQDVYVWATYKIVSESEV